MKRLLLAWWLLALAAAPPVQARPGLAGELLRVRELLESWNAAEAARLADGLARHHPEEPELQLMRARVRFYQGRYDEALALVAGLRTAGSSPALEHAAREFESMLEPVARIASRFQAHSSEHFTLYVEPGPDLVMVPEALRVLEASWRQVGSDFDLFPGERIRVEIYPDAESFQQASTLTRDQIQTSGTIALCKFNRIMILTPRQVLRGYPWCRTLAHEYTHYVLWRRSGPSVPIWLHEGVARYEETRWAGGERAELDPLMKDVLADALRDGALLGFEEMHPSFALIDDPRKVAIAGAEVLAVVQTLVERGGYELLVRMLDELSAGHEWPRVFERTLGQSFETFMAEFQAIWSERLRGHGGVAIPGALVELANGESHAGRQASADGEQATVARFRRLGEILAERGELTGDRRFHQAAALEYERAVQASEPGRELLVAWAHELRRSGRWSDAEQALERALALDPGHAGTLKALGRVLRASGRADEATEALTASFRVSPFDPEVHELLAELHGALGNAALRREARSHLELLRRPHLSSRSQ